MIIHFRQSSRTLAMSRSVTTVTFRPLPTRQIMRPSRVHVATTPSTDRAFCRSSERRFVQFSVITSRVPFKFQLSLNQKRTFGMENLLFRTYGPSNYRTFGLESSHHLVSMPGEVKDPTSLHWNMQLSWTPPLLEKDNSKNNPVYNTQV